MEATDTPSVSVHSPLCLRCACLSTKIRAVSCEGSELLWCGSERSA